MPRTDSDASQELSTQPSETPGNDDHAGGPQPSRTWRGWLIAAGGVGLGVAAIGVAVYMLRKRGLLQMPTMLRPRPPAVMVAPPMPIVPFSELLRTLAAAASKEGSRAALWVGERWMEIVAELPKEAVPGASVLLPADAPATVRVLQRAAVNDTILSLYGDTLKDILATDLLVGSAETSTPRVSVRVGTYSEMLAAMRSVGVRPAWMDTTLGRTVLGAAASALAIVLANVIIQSLQSSGASDGVNLSQRRGDASGRGRDVPDVTFADVAGIDSCRREVEEIVTFLKDPARFERLGARCPRGILLHGEPGTGKTLLARALAGEARVPFYFMSASEFVEVYVGRGAARVRALFAQARQNAPCIVFIDELDAVGRARSSGLLPGDSAHDEREQTLNALLVELDGFASGVSPDGTGSSPAPKPAWTRTWHAFRTALGLSAPPEPPSNVRGMGAQGVLVIASTNRADTLDPALTRPGRFDRILRVPVPDAAGRAAILRTIAARNRVQVENNFDWDRLAALPALHRRTGAALGALVNEAAVEAVRQGKDVVDMDAFTAALRRM